MATRITTSFALTLGCVAGLGLAIPREARADTCPWGGDESQSIRCFDCMKPVWNGQRWTLMNFCRQRVFYGFQRGILGIPPIVRPGDP
jgi:hypothetical protein